MPSWPTQTSWPSKTSWPGGTSWPAGGGNWPAGGGGPPPFSGNFIDLFPTAYQIVQSDKGLSYGASLLANAGNTAATTIAVSGAIVGVPVPVWAVATNSLAVGAGATFNVYYDGLGVTPAMVGLTPTGGATIALTGAGTGLGLKWTAASSVAGNGWKAVCAGLADQSGNGANFFTQEVSGDKSPIITAGINGKPGLGFNGIDMVIRSSFSIAPPLDLMIWIVASCDFTGFATRALFAGASASQMFINFSTANQFSFMAGGNTNVPSGGGNNTSRALLVGTHRASGNCSAQWGNLPEQTALITPSGGNSLYFLGAQGNTRFAAAEVFAVGMIPIGDLSAFRAALNSPGGYGPGAILL